MPSEREVTLEQFRDHLQALPPGRRIDEVVVHHTWSPTAAQYRGLATVRGVRNYHMQVRGWSDNGYHVMIGPDGRIFLCRPLQRSGAHVAGRNAHTVGVSFIANFDSEDPQAYGGMQAGRDVVAALLERFDLATTDIRFHREFAPKTCPGLKLSLAEFRSAVASDAAGPTPARLVVLLPGYEHTAAPMFQNGTHYLTVRQVADLFGLDLIDNRATNGKLYLREPGEAGG